MKSYLYLLLVIKITKKINQTLYCLTFKELIIKIALKLKKCFISVWKLYVCILNYNP